jgi:hypothetical protein
MRLAFRLQRFEIIAVAIAVIVLVISAFIVRSRLDAATVTPECWQVWFGPSTGVGPNGGGPCDGPVQAFLTISEDEAGKVMAAMALLPLAVGLFLGVPLVAREIEAGTAPTVWFLAGSRSRWLLGRIVPVVVVLLLLLGALALASDVLWSGREPWSPALRFGDAGLHGPVVAAKGLAAFGVALLAGAALGRLLPAIIVATALALVLYLGGETAMSAWLHDESMRHVVVVNPQNGGGLDLFPGGTYVSQLWQAPDGTLLNDDEAQRLVPAGVADRYAWLYDNLKTVMAGVPGTLYPQWSLMETAGYGAIGVGALILAFPVVSRRRPQ